MNKSCLIVAVIFSAPFLLILSIIQKFQYAAVIGPVLITILVLNAMRSPDPSPELADSLELPDLDDEIHKTLITLYDKTTQMHVESDRGMYQIIGIFVPASLFVLGWVLSNPKNNQVTSEPTVIIGSMAMVLVGVATLIKHRLRYYNKIREIYLRKLESHLLNKEPDKNPGLHNFMKNSYSPTGISFHEVVDIYFFLHMGVWIIIWITKL